MAMSNTVYVRTSRSIMTAVSPNSRVILSKLHVRLYIFDPKSRSCIFRLGPGHKAIFSSYFPIFL